MTKARAGVNWPNKVKPNSFMAIAETIPIKPETAIMPEKYFHLKGTFLYENWCFIKPTSPLMKPPPKAARKIYVNIVLILTLVIKNL